MDFRSQSPDATPAIRHRWALPGRRVGARLIVALLPILGCSGSDGDGGGPGPGTSSQPAAPGNPQDSAGASGTPAAAVPIAAPDPSRVDVRTVASGLDTPWSFDFLPDGRIIVTEKAGRIRIVAPDGSVGTPVAGVPPVFTVGQGGLLDIVASPEFAVDSTVFFGIAEPDPGGGARTALARARLDTTQPSAPTLDAVEVIFRQNTSNAGGNHFGSRIVFSGDGLLWFALGERNEPAQARRLDNHLGKVVRIRRNGTVPDDNPFVATPGAVPELYSFGHRNIQGAARHPVTGRLWLTEHGPLGGDEVNVSSAGRDYGWPRITYGRDYATGEPFGEATTAPDVEAPLHVWVPTSIAPSGMAFYTGTTVPGWRDSVFIGALAGQALVRLSLDGERVVAEERLLTGLQERIRTVRMGPDGNVWILTDSPNGRLLQVTVR